MDRVLGGAAILVAITTCGGARRTNTIKSLGRRVLKSLLWKVMAMGKIVWTWCQRRKIHVSYQTEDRGGQILTDRLQARFFSGSI
jgi:hypothetical protein